ncbi:hypothetical protein ACP4OV_029196 [Aristida adscensionis]
MVPPPNAFSNELGQWVYNEFITSIMFVELRAIKPARVREFWESVAPIPNPNTAAGKAKRLERRRQSEDSLSATGFVLRQTSHSIWILTCAHVLGPAYGRNRPITVQKIGDLFTAWITCDHQEQHFLGGEYQERVYTRAEVVDVCCEMDLLLLRVRTADFCPELHRPLSISAHAPVPLERVVMLSWPPLRNRTATVGELSHQGREHRSVSRSNPRGYEMLLSEVSIPSDIGSSGAPLINGAGEVVAVLQSGFGGRFSYFISLDNIQQAVQEFGF